MNRQELFNLTAPTKQMPENVFLELINKAILEIHSENEFSFEAKHSNYEIDFYMSDNQMHIECFGFNKNGWIELEPTDSQMEQMKSKLEAVEIVQDIEPDSGYIDYYFENGVSRENFY